ncbi:uncharacterized protein LOC119615874 [Lucilia sericata]|uniref:uncharacterized protein LOC119615874 n=1 Tax=Lucilia sericata TaxID=13632 RepID=UPI0018A7EFAF|nr:uncharacterized protein LOC119615874 [Lucilia sericata]
MIQHGNTYPIIEKLGCLTEGQFNVLSHDARMSNLHAKVKENLAVAHEKAEKTYNLRCRDVQYKTGQEIFRKNFQQSDFKKGINSKLIPPYIKCRIRRRVGSSMYELENLNGKYIGIYHAKDLKSS